MTSVIIQPDWLKRNKDGSLWYVRTFRITTIRIFSQLFFFALFTFLLWATWFSRLEGYPVSLFLEVDPLVGVATALSTHTVYRWLWRGLWGAPTPSFPTSPRNRTSPTSSSACRTTRAPRTSRS